MDIGVLTLAVAALAIVSVRAAWRAVVLRKTDPGGRKARAWWAAILTLSAMGAWYVEAAHHQRQDLVSHALQVITENPQSRADCQRVTESLFDASIYDGFVYHNNTDLALFKRHVCHDVASYARGGQARPSTEQIAAVHLVAHEAWHMLGVWNEAEAECRAVQLNHHVAEFLGATPDQARELQRRYFDEIYPHLRNDYTSRECREGGSLDIHPDRTEFP